MINTLKRSLWRQFGASVDSLENIINLCPDHLWDTDILFWYWSYHTLFWTDYYLTLDPNNFQPPAPFTLSEFDTDGALPDRTYNKIELLDYLQFCGDKAYFLIYELTAESVQKPWISKTKNFTVLEILLYNMRHIQHHVAQLNKILRHEINDASPWVSISKRELI